MQKAQNTLNEIHEMAKAKGKKFERVVASAGTTGVGDLSMGTDKIPDMSSNGHAIDGTNSRNNSIDNMRHNSLELKNK